MLWPTKPQAPRAFFFRQSYDNPYARSHRATLRLYRLGAALRVADGKGALSLEAGLADWKRAHSELAKRLNPEASWRLALAAEALEES